jgi:hypothetical protein
MSCCTGHFLLPLRTGLLIVSECSGLQNNSLDLVWVEKQEVYSNIEHVAFPSKVRPLPARRLPGHLPVLLHQKTPQQPAAGAGSSSRTPTAWRAPPQHHQHARHWHSSVDKQVTLLLWSCHCRPLGRGTRRATVTTLMLTQHLQDPAWSIGQWAHIQKSGKKTGQTTRY